MENIVLVGLQDAKTRREEVVESLNELALLVKTARGRLNILSSKKEIKLTLHI